MSLIVMDKLRSSLSRPLSMSLPYSNTSTSLDLWGVLFSRAFAALAEDLLSESLAKVSGHWHSERGSSKGPSHSLRLLLF